jgi:thioester reductase-like protein
MEPVPIGCVGDLYIGGAGVARGYWRRPELTDQRFIADPFRSGERVYRTGDLARYMPNGDIVCLGRVDDQVKVHGVRIELGEVEMLLRGVPGVRDAVVAAWTDPAGNAQLVGHVIADGSVELAPALIRARLREALPEAMIPPHILFTDRFPLTANGKIHRAALPGPTPGGSGAAGTKAVPANATERLLADAWSRVLQIDVDRIGRDDAFLDLGGHSLLMTQLMLEVRKLFHISFSMRELFDAPTLSKLAARIDEYRRARTAEGPGGTPAGAVRDSEWGKQRMAYLRREAELPAGIAPARGLSYEAPAKIQSLLLTGPTGFVGAYILADVLDSTDADVYCLVRPRHGVPSKSRIEDQMRAYELWHDDEAWRAEWDHRVHVVEGDVILPRLGLADPAYESLARSVDCIIHSAAHVNFIYPYEALRATNVLGVHEIIRFAFHARIKPVHYLSTAAIWPMGSGYTFYEKDSIDHGMLLNLGYDEAKWVGERCLVNAAERGLPAARYRPGEVGGDSETGRLVLSHFIVAAFRGFLQMGAFPTVDTFLDVTPVDYVAKAVVHMAFRTNAIGKAFHLTNPGRCHLSEALTYLRGLGYSFEEMPFAELRERLVQDSAFSANALFPYQAALEDMDERSLQIPRYDCRQTLRELEGTGIVCPPLDRRLLGTYLNHLIRIGYLEQPATVSIGA